MDDPNEPITPTELLDVLEGLFSLLDSRAQMTFEQQAAYFRAKRLLARIRKSGAP